MSESRHAPLAIVVHGGAWNIPEEYHAAHRAGCEVAVAEGWRVLVDGGSALDAVEATIRIMEDDPTYDAGRGSVLNADGSIELDAGIMDGESLKIGAVAAIRHYANPISVARRVMEVTEHHFLVGPGAELFAARQGFEVVDNKSLVVPREQDAYERFLIGDLTAADSFGGHDTVGAVALDARGQLAAGNSTGGVSFSMPGRVGDAPLPGVGYYADSRAGAAACTGWGEQIMRAGLALRVIQNMERGMSASEAAEMAIELLRDRVRGQAGVIALDPAGRVGLSHSTGCLAHAFRTTEMAGVTSGIRVSRL